MIQFSEDFPMPMFVGALGLIFATCCNRRKHRRVFLEVRYRRLWIQQPLGRTPVSGVRSAVSDVVDDDNSGKRLLRS
jgi:hypothetical protein